MPRRLTFTQLSVQEQPLVYLAAAFILGEMLATHTPMHAMHGWLGLALLLFAIALILFSHPLRSLASDKIITGVLLTACMASGASFWSIQTAALASNRLVQAFAHGLVQPDEPVEIVGVIQNVPELAPDRIYLELALEQFTTFGKTTATTGAIRVVVPVKTPEDRAEYDNLQLHYGTRIRALALLRKSAGFRNPGAINFDELLGFQGFDASGSIKSPLLIERLAITNPNLILNFLYTMRAHAIAVILRSFTQPTAGILAASLFANQHFLAQETAESFRIGGTFHLLVISGLHVAMLALVANWIIAKITRWRWLRFGLSLTLLWCYALMIGLQPAITRATVMLTIVLAGELIFRTSPGANTLAATALILLAWQPRDVFSPGLQLSFLTVLVIVLLTVPLWDRVRRIGTWEPSAVTPYPPRVPRWLKASAEILYWNEAEFQQEMSKAPIHYQVEKAASARWISATRWRQWLQISLRWSCVTMISTVLIQVGLLPLMIANFHRISLVAPLTNAIQGVAMFVLMLTGIGYLSLYAIFGSALAALAPLLNRIGNITAHGVDWLLLSRKLNFRVPDYGANSIWLYSIYFLLVLFFVIALQRWNPFTRLAPTTMQNPVQRRWYYVACSGATIVLAVLIWLFIWHPISHNFAPGRLSITFLDVGQGDAILIRFPNGKLMLLDSGGRIPTDLAQTDTMQDDGETVFVEDRLSIGEAAVAPFLWHHGIQRLDYIVASHGHADHTQGFEDIGKSFVIREALTGIIPTNDAQFVSFQAAAALNQAPLRPVARGEKMIIDGVLLEALTPFPEGRPVPVAANNQSLTLRLQFGQRTFLLTGDIEKEIEARLVTADTPLTADVLKVAHHGSRSSSTPDFLQRVQPQYAIISAAYPSPFEHPHPETLTALRQIGANILQTSQCGAITVSTNGTDLHVETFVPCR